MTTRNHDETDTTKDLSGLDRFDLLDPEVQSAPWDFYKALHEKCPVYRMPQNGYYVIAGYNELKSALMDPDRFSNQAMRHKMLQPSKLSNIFADMLKERGWEPYLTLQRADPPEHRRYRKIIDRVLNPKNVRGLLPRIEELSHQLVDGFADRGECDWIGEYAFPLPGTIIAEQIGLDPSEIKTFKKWGDNILSLFTKSKTEEQMRECAEIEIEMQHYMVKIFEDRKKNPRDDIISNLVNTQEGEDELTLQEQLSVMNQLIGGGYETLISALTHQMWQLIRFPQVEAELRADRSLIRNFINESLRYESPTQGLFRITKEEVELGGTTIPEGSVCLSRYGAANRDPKVFQSPDEFNIHRDRVSQHLAFGTGIHFCPGAALARAEMTITWNVILDRLEGFELAEPMPCPAHEPSLQLLPMKQLKLRFKKRDVPEQTPISL
ncbi:MAG: cytochrome P450 [Pseudomonadota bacterium]|nr:cytochrome P450 [Pseudomonadota bacterium]